MVEPVDAVQAHVEHAEAPAADVVQDGGHGPVAHADSGHHGFDLQKALQHHNQGYPAVEWLHNKPVLIFNRDKFVALKQSHGYTAEQIDGMVAQAAVLPSSLSFFNTQTFFGTIALVLMSVFLLVVAKRKASQIVPRGRFQNVVEVIVQFVRTDIVRPNIHHGDAWTAHFTALFLGILSFNLMGLVPGTGTASGNFGVTAAFASTTLLTMLVFGMKEQGVFAFWKNLVPVHFSFKPMDFAVWLLLALIEVMSLVIKPVALAIRLFANMFAGHTVLLAFTSLFFILQSAGAADAMTSGLGAAGLGMAIAIYLLELLVALVQAYVFTLLSAVFVGASIHPEH